MRLIDASELLEHLEACSQNGRPLSHLYDLREIVRYVESMPTVPAPRWHRVEEPPKEGQNVLTMDANEDMETATYDGEGFEDSYGFYITNVLYWMPIEPPNEIRVSEPQEVCESVNHPTHYHNSMYECIDLMREIFGDEMVRSFCVLNAYKYRFRAGNKQGAAANDDIAKAEWYEAYVMEKVPCNYKAWSDRRKCDD